MNYDNYLESLIEKTAKYFLSSKYNMAQKKGLLNLYRNFSKRSLANRTAARAKLGFAPDGYVVGITNECNLYCQYCYSDCGPNNLVDIDLDKLNIIINEMNQYFGIRFLTITGGETFPKIIDISRSHPKVTFNVYTNGTTLDDYVCKEIKKLGNIVPSITIIADNEKHDKIRGKGCHDKILEAISLLNKHYIIWGFSLTASSYNFEDIVDGDLLEALSRYSPHYIRMLPYMPVGREHDQEMILDSSMRNRLGNLIREFNISSSIHIHDYIDDDSLGINCLAGGNKSLFINEKLEVSPCVFMGIGTPIEFNMEQRSSNLINLLIGHKHFINARALSKQYPRCIILNDPDWIEHIKDTAQCSDISSCIR